MLPERWKTKLKPYYRTARSLADRVKIGLWVLVAKLVRVVRRPPFPDSSGGVFLNLGCGATNHPRFINIDGFPHPHVHLVQRVDRLPSFPDGSVDLIYASHCLEHFRYREIPGVLREWVRVLRPGGTLRLSVPDYDKLAAICTDTGDPDDIVEQLMGGQDNRYNYHYAVFNRRNLAKYLTQAGCVEIREWTPGTDELTTFDDFSVWHKKIGDREYPISLNIEARKG